MNDEISIPDPLKMPGGGRARDLPMTEKEMKKKKRKDKKREKKRKEKEKKKRDKERAKQKQKDKEAKEAAKVGQKPEDSKPEEEEEKPDRDGEDLMHPLEMPRVESEDTDSKGGSCDEPNPAANIEDNNLLGDTYFDVKSDHCLQPLLPQQNSYNRNMVLTMGHSGVKFIIEKVSGCLE